MSTVVKNNGEMAEWLKAHAWKACIRESVSRVRIPISPPFLPFKIPHIKQLFISKIVVSLFFKLALFAPILKGIVPTESLFL